MKIRTHSLLIEKASRAVGGEDKLCVLLGVSWPDLHGWLDSGAPMPPTVFLKLVDVLDHAGASRCSPPPPVHRFLQDDYESASLAAVCEAALDAALVVAGTDMGNVQLVDADGILRIESQRGFEAPFLEFFAGVKGTESACGVARMTGRQFVVADVENHPVFCGTDAGAVLLAAGVRAVECSPIIGPSGSTVGMLSVHHRQPGKPDEAVMVLLARIARRAGARLEAEAPR